jgi:hypothetical protein
LLSKAGRSRRLFMADLREKLKLRLDAGAASAYLLG